MDEVGDLIKYKVDFPGAIDPDGIDARNANKIGNIFAESAKKFGYDLSGKVPRITEKTKGFSDYFKSPVVDKAKDVPEKILTPKTPQDVVSSITAEEKEKLKLLGIDVEEAFKNVKTVGKAVIKKIPVVSGIAVTAEMLRRGVAPSTAFAYGASELLPISASDADTAGAFARKAREEGLPKAIGLDTEKQEQMNIMRKQRLADRVKRNTSVTPPPEEGFINQNEIGRQ